MMVQILNNGAPATNARRIWLQPGVPVLIDTGCTVRLMNTIQDDEPAPLLILDTLQGFQFETAITTGMQLVAYPYAPVIVEPKAAQLDHLGRVDSLLTDIIPDALAVHANNLLNADHDD